MNTNGLVCTPASAPSRSSFHFTSITIVPNTAAHWHAEPAEGWRVEFMVVGTIPRQSSRNNHLLCCWLSLGVDGCCCVVGHHWVSLGVVGCRWVSLGVVGCWVLLGVTGHCWMLLDVVGHCWVLFSHAIHKCVRTCLHVHKRIVLPVPLP